MSASASGRPRLLDLYCGAGGSAIGYYRAGFDVEGVDIVPQPHYPFPFHVGDALEYVREHGHEYATIHASPPCQAFSYAGFWRKDGREYPNLIPATRMALEATGRPYVIENVRLAPLVRCLLLCGSMFGEEWHRHRWFESSLLLMGPAHTQHRSRGRYEPGKIALRYMDEDLTHMGLDWMTRMERRQAIPPVYGEYIGHQLLRAVCPEEAAV